MRKISHLERTRRERGEKGRDFDTSADVITRRRRLLLLLLLLPRIDCHIKTVQKVGYEFHFRKWEMEARRQEREMKRRKRETGVDFGRLVLVW